MKLGTPGFIGAQLRRAREARGLSAIALADLLEVSRAAVSQYESGSQTPRPQIMERIVEILKVPEHHFRQDITVKSGTVFYRSLSAATKMARGRAEVRFLWLKQIVAYLRESVQFAHVNIPKFDVPNEPSHISGQQIEELAMQTRRFWQLGEGPLGNIVWMLENNGFIVARDELGADTLDAFSEFNREDTTPYVVLGSDKGVAVRSRYDVAHELGHILLHHDVDRTRFAKTPEHQMIEAQAHWFAGAFLLPAQSYAKDFYSANLDLLQRLKPKWKVSIAMMLKRAEDLEFISTAQVKPFWINYSRRGWRRQEPLDDKLEIETPCFLRKAFELLVNEKAQSKEQILARIPLAPRDIENLAALDRGYLDPGHKDIEPMVHILKPSAKPKQTQQEKVVSPAQVLQFPHKKK